ncbi:Na/Pi cotransporter family protein [Falcatimonas sp. MSJ-15]|uniref:Na/Pi cotransporter family protein n=1 Tax=Falcatimonas sp. MSJ-15 TaxID=2841515 RepID=UPI001C10CCE6|nr:Na/Pi cotransporter family protein [Falcatimonas sp. MSJ-15]MBU5469591.1 Na/Pi cotransporter family protein [Falcatimonas sp. MSJ-15]
MDIFGVLTMIGGLALFLYGMNIMGDGLGKVSGGRLEKILETLTSNPIKAVLLGAGVTAVIQSSSATTVMVVGFVNSGIMKLSQAIGIIMGANVGTTITSWLLSLSGIESGNIFVNMLKPSSFSPILALVGIIFILFTKSEKKHDIGNILLGFTILMFGMDTMSNAVKPLADVPEFTNILIRFSNPVLGLIAGAILTAVIQSSSASVGILQALCKTGAVTFGTAIPIIMGQNIGTCITAIISGIGANKNAKRAAIVHLYFNIIGTTLFMVVFYLLNAVLNFSFLDDSANAFNIAVIHSIFNVSATFVLLPFTKLLEKLATLTIRDDEEKEVQNNEFGLLDVRFLDTPSLAVEHCSDLTEKMADITKECVYRAIDLIDNYSNDEATAIEDLEERIDKYEDEIGSYLVLLSKKSITDKDSNTLSLLLHEIGDFERMSDHAVNIVQAAREMNSKKLEFSKKATKELAVFSRAVKDIVDLSVNVFKTRDENMALSVEPLEEVIDYLNKEVKARHIKRLSKGKCTIDMGFILSDIITNYERIADHCSNIAVGLIEINHDGYDVHEYLNTLKADGNDEFREKYLACKEKYQL